MNTVLAKFSSRRLSTFSCSRISNSRRLRLTGATFIACLFQPVWFQSALAEEVSGSIVPDDGYRVGCQDHLAAQSYARAVEAANVALTSSVSSDQEQSQRFDLLVCRGSAHEGQRSTNLAERDFREALSVAARNFDPFDERLIDPLTRLGRLRYNADDPDEAELLLLRAKDITHRTAGIYNVEQDYVLDDLAEVFMRQGRQQQASKQQELRLRAARENHGDTTQLVEALHNYAIWNARVQDFPKVRVALEEAVSILEDAYGENDPRLIDTLKLRTRLYKRHPSIPTHKAGEEAMKRVVRIYSSQPYVDQVDLLKARTDVGDWYLQGLQRSKANRYYKKTVKRAVADKVDQQLIDKFYGAPKLIFLQRDVATFYGRNEAGKLLAPGKIRMIYDVATNGRAKNIRVLEDTVNIPLITNNIYGRIQQAAFRPRFKNGKAVITRNVEQQFDIDQTESGLELGKIYAPVLSIKK